MNQYNKLDHLRMLCQCSDCVVVSIISHLLISPCCNLEGLTHILSCLNLNCEVLIRILIIRLSLFSCREKHHFTVFHWTVQKSDLKYGAKTQQGHYILAFSLWILFFFFKSYSWVTCCVSFRYTAVIYLYIYLFFFRFFSHIGYCRILSRVLCAIQ